MPSWERLFTAGLGRRNPWWGIGAICVVVLAVSSIAWESPGVIHSATGAWGADAEMTTAMSVAGILIVVASSLVARWFVRPPGRNAVRTPARDQALQQDVLFRRTVVRASIAVGPLLYLALNFFGLALVAFSGDMHGNRTAALTAFQILWLLEGLFWGLVGTFMVAAIRWGQSQRRALQAEEDPQRVYPAA